MSNPDDQNEPAFPVPPENHGQPTGFTKREQACIELCVPETDKPWLNALINKARRDRFAMAALQGICAHTTTGALSFADINTLVIKQVDEMLAQSGKEGK